MDLNISYRYIIGQKPVGIEYDSLKSTYTQLKIFSFIYVTESLIYGY